MFVLSEIFYDAVLVLSISRSSKKLTKLGKEFYRNWEVVFECQCCNDENCVYEIQEKLTWVRDDENDIFSSQRAKPVYCITCNDHSGNFHSGDILTLVITETHMDRLKQAWLTEPW